MWCVLLYARGVFLFYVCFISIYKSEWGCMCLYGIFLLSLSFPIRITNETHISISIFHKINMPLNIFYNNILLMHAVSVFYP